ncbi:MAG: protein kinase [Pseudomonadota bacterium]
MANPEIPGYSIVRELGAGGMAQVYLAVQENLHREVALKVMIPGLSVDEISCHRFLKEGRIAAQLNHQNLLTVYDIGVHEEQYYMASEFLPGGTARDRLNDGLKLDDVIKIISDIAQGLQYAHSKGFVHRDVKPGNLLFRANGECVLGDFGIAKSVDSTTNATQLGTSIGTPHYMSPEQAKGEKVDHRTDLYSLGILFYELLTGKPPFDADDPFTVALAQINEPVPKMEDENARFQQVIEKLMEKNRDERYDSADAFLEDLEVLTGHVGAGRKTTRKKVPSSQMNIGVGTPGAGGKVGRIVGAIVLVAMVSYGGFAIYKGFVGPGGETNDPVVEDSRDGQVATLLQRAEDAIGELRFFSPEGQSAIDFLEEALRVDPTNTAARSRLSGLVALAEQAAEGLWEQGQGDDARRIVSEGLKRYPSDPGLRYLLGRMDSQPSGQPTSTPAPAQAGGDLEDTLARATRLVSLGELAEATKLYRQVLTQDPGNAAAETALDRIAGQWAVAAQNVFRQGQLETAKSMVEQGLAARPDDARLNELAEQIEAALSEG